MSSRGKEERDIYRDFATCYERGEYDSFSYKMARLLPDILGDFSLHPEKVLDLACGEGTFAVELAKLGYRVTGVDLSGEMLDLARRSAEGLDREIEFVKKDMREISFAEEFDLVTSWFDSMNYLRDEDDWRRVFDNVHGALREEGVFIFDMNTVHGLSVEWGKNSCYVVQDESEIFEVHRTEYDPEEKLATLKITGFVKEEETWEKFEEEHREKTYPLEKVEEIFVDRGFEKLACWDSPRDRTEPDEESGRVWFVLKKKTKP